MVCTILFEKKIRNRSFEAKEKMGKKHAHFFCTNYHIRKKPTSVTSRSFVQRSATITNDVILSLITLATVLTGVRVTVIFQTARILHYTDVGDSEHIVHTIGLFGHSVQIIIIDLDISHTTGESKPNIHCAFELENIAHLRQPGFPVDDKFHHVTVFGILDVVYEEGCGMPFSIVIFFFGCFNDLQSMSKIKTQLNTTFTIKFQL